ncbi:alternative oxidase [Phlyctema vagabunda]|uniref:Alternative oxidase n=1 Tax=Phlyctema vagabunda TaxID=108571 RepID=A0ABR4P9E9_9HELO
MSEEEFLNAALATDIYHQKYNGAGLQKLCNETRWREGYIFSCEQVGGGIGNIRAAFLGCLRFTIEAGGAFIIPKINPQKAYGEHGLSSSLTWEAFNEIDQVFDRKHFIRTMKSDCPQLEIIDDRSKLWEFQSSSSPIPLNPKELVQTIHNGSVITNPADWALAFDAWLENVHLFTEDGLPLKPSKKVPIRIGLLEESFAWPIAYDVPDFTDNFGRVFKFPGRLRRLSAKALYSLYAKFNIQQNPAHVSTKAFLGAYVGTQQTRELKPRQSFDEQAAHILEQVALQKLPHIFIASDSPADTEILRRELQRPRSLPGVDTTNTSSIKMFTVWDLLEDKDHEDFKSLTWDQMELVDHDILLRSSYFVGPSQSNFSWLLALQRQASSKNHAYNLGEIPGNTWHDNRSCIYGSDGARTMIASPMWV